MKSSTPILALALLVVVPALGEEVAPNPKKEEAEIIEEGRQTETKTKTKVRASDTKNPSTLNPKTKQPKGPFKFTLNGLADEWDGISPLFPSPGEKVDDPGFSVDIIKVYMTNDKDFVYFLMRCLPTIQERFKNNGIGGGFGDLYFDLDNNRETGSTDTDVGAFGYGNGFELKAFVELGVHDLHGPDEKPYVHHTLKRLHISGADFGSKRLSDLNFTEVPEALAKKRSYEWKDVPDGAQFSHKPNSRIAFGEDGVEFKIPMKMFGLRPGQTMRVMLAEDAHEFKMEGYTVGPYTVK